MGVKISTKTDKLAEIRMAMNGLKNKNVVIGAMNGNNAWLAGIHEYGVDIPITPKMRVWLHANGLHVKDSTTVIKIPERAFLRNGHDENVDRIMTQTERLLPFVISGKMSPDSMLNECGRQMATAIKEYMSQTQANHPFTVDRKGSSTPLTGTTGGLVNSITWEVE